ncbi:MAG: ATP-binding protein [Xanthobacteraceae bacterium]|jgi:PAS domain S-box-containing protein
MLVKATQLRSGGGKPDRLRTRVNLALLSVFLFFVLLWNLLLWYRYDQTIQESERRANNLALILTEHLQRSVDAVDAALVQLSVHSQRVGGPKAAADTWIPILRAAQAGAGWDSSISVIDETGQITASTMTEVIGRSRRDLPSFERLANDPDSGLVADPPFRSSFTGQLLLPLARRLTARDGSFAGIVVAMVRPEQLRAFYRSVDVGPHGLISVLHPAGRVVFREPSRQDPIGRPAQNDPIFLAQRQSPRSGELRGPLWEGGLPFLTAYRSLSSPALLVAVSLAVQDVLAVWWQVTLLAIGLTAALGSALLLAAVLIMREIRDRTAATARLIETDAALRASQQRLRAMMEHTPLMVTEKDLAGRYTFVNRSFQERLGLTAAEVIGKTAYEVFRFDRAEAQTSIDREVIATRGPVQRELTISTPEPRTVLFTKFPLIDSTGAVEAVGTIGVDVTELKHAEIQLAHAQKMDAIGQLTGGVAHDFNNLLTAILLNADVLADRMSDDKLRPLAEATRMAAERGADLTKRLLAFGRRQTLEPRPTDVNGLVAGMEQLMRRTLGEHIAIDIRAAPDLWPATVDPGQLEAAVVNLALNARDAMPQGGRITIETGNVEIDEGYAALNADVRPGDYIMIGVSDTGTGMPADVLSRAFEPFFTTKEVGKGTGLGLSMIYGFVKQSGGHARIYSEVGVGTVVRLYLPRSHVPAEAGAVRHRPAGALPTGGETILLVEDDPLVRKHTEHQLVDLGYRVVAAENAAEALDRVKEGTMPDLLFTDIVMPGSINGRELADQLRARWPHLKVLYTSGFSHGMLDTPLGGQAAPQHLLAKPFRRRDLATKVREVLDEAAAA